MAGRGDGTGWMGLMLLGVATIPGYLVWDTWSTAEAEKAAWNVAGPDCPVVPRPTYKLRRPPKTFRYGDVTFSRISGGVSCAAFRDGGLWRSELYRVCQFNNPGAVTVTTSSGSVVFQPHAGRVTVTVRGATPSCKVGGWFRM